MKKTIVVLISLLIAVRLCAEIPQTIKLPLWKKGIYLSLRGQADVFKEASEDSPKLLVEGAGWGEQYPFGVNFWSGEPEPTGGKQVYRHPVGSGNSSHPLVDYDGHQWYKVQVYDREGWLHIGGDVPTCEFEPLKLDADGKVEVWAYYSNYDPYVYVRQDGRYKGMCLMVYDCPNGVQGIAFGALINGMAIMPLFLPMRIECSFADLPLEITYADATHPFGKMRYPYSEYTNEVGGFNPNKFSDEQLIKLIQKAKSLDNYMIAFKLKNQQAKLTEFNTRTATVPMQEVPFQPGDYKTDTQPEEVSGQSNESQPGEKVFENAEVAPSFPGGMGAMMSWIGKNMKYPEYAQNKNIQGRVMVRFIVLSDGSIGEVQVAKSVEQTLDNEAVRLIKAMPKWNPGSIGGTPVNTWYTLPITFKLN